MRKFVVIYDENDWSEKIPMSESPMTRKAFENWHKRGLKNGIAMFRASIRWFDEKKGFFKKSWAYRDKKWIKINKPIKPDLILDKTAGKYDYETFNLKMKIARKIKTYNHPLFRTMLSNKLSQHLCFGEFMPQSFLATDKKELEDRLKRIRGSKAVIKPLYGSGGFGITIKNKKEIDRRKITLPSLIQEFVKSEKGIPGFSKKKEISDLRMIFINHRFVYAVSRVAKKGSLFTNFHQGASVVLVPKKSIPTSAIKTANKVTAKLSLFSNANYALDFIFTNSGRPVLVEMNTVPGLDLLYIVGTEKIKDKYFSEIIRNINA
jgi:glutathione synthase/RimK-type ligase-like ATP-grasp enzyme